MDKMVEIIRIQRHDFLNNLQVVSGLIQLGKADQAIEYIHKISQEMAVDGQITKLARPELAAVLLWQRIEAAQKDIQLKFNINTDLSRLKITGPEIAEMVNAMLVTVQAETAPGGQIELNIWLENDKYLVRCLWPKSEQAVSTNTLIFEVG